MHADDTHETKLRAVLRECWGFDQFLPLQQDAMQCVMAGRDSLVVLPTGGGKSLCFQAPAMCQPALTVVVSPLISLMKDQVDALKSCGIRAACVNSLMALDERQAVADEIRGRRLRLLYLAPERLLADRTLEFLRSVGVAFFAIDEAHCISAWGHDFRPEYRELRVLRDYFPDAALHAYTATATERVRDDILTQLRLRSPQVLVGSFDRANLVYRVRRRHNLLGQIREVLERHANQSGIVYCISRAEVENMSAALNELGYRTLPYHAGLSDGARHANQEAFIKERIDTIVATVAFGMGIDKSNVRYVVHAGMPKSLEAYQQESGRAGRDGLEAECCLLYSGRDVIVWKKLLQSESPEGAPGALAALDAISAYATGVRCRHRALVEYFGQPYALPCCEACDVCLGELDLVEDPETIARQILSCVVRLEQRFGAEYVSLVLSGSRDQRILQNRHDELSTYGLLSESSRRDVRDWIEQLVSQNYLQKTADFHVLSITAPGRQVLRGAATVRLLRPAESGRASRVDIASWEGVDRPLFEHLRQLRQAVAAERGVPAYVVFSDASLREMARRRPSSLDNFRSLHGVGEQKYKQFGPLFTRAIGQFCRTHQLATDQRPRSELSGTVPAATPSPSPAAWKSFELFRAGKSVEEVAAAMQRAASTVHGYLYQYIRHEGITDHAAWVPANTARRILDAIRAVGSLDRLSPIYRHLGAEIPYEKIRIVVACLQNDPEQAQVFSLQSR